MSNPGRTDDQLARMWVRECRLRREQIAADKRRDDEMRGLTRESKPQREGGSHA